MRKLTVGLILALTFLFIPSTAYAHDDGDRGDKKGCPKSIEKKGCHTRVDCENDQNYECQPTRHKVDDDHDCSKGHYRCPPRHRDEVASPAHKNKKCANSYTVACGGKSCSGGGKPRAGRCHK